MRQGRHAFTLTELLVVISIIAILAGMLMPAITQVKQSALSVSCKNRERQLGLAMTVYAHDQKGFLPADYSSINGSGFYWHAINEYVQLLDLPTSFSAAQKRARLLDPADKNTSSGNYVGPNAAFPLVHVSDYAANKYMVARSSASYRFCGGSMPLPAITHPAESLLLTCGSAGLSNGNDWWVVSEVFATATGAFPGTTCALMFRHGGTTLNQVMGDLHVESRSLAQMPASPGNLVTAANDAGRQYWMKYP